MNILCEYGCGLPGINQLKNGKFCCSKFVSSCSVNKVKNANALKEAYKNGNRKSGKELYKNLTVEAKNKMAWSRGKSSYDDSRIRKKYTDEFIFKENSDVSNIVVKNRLMSSECFEHKCKLCLTEEWFDPFEKKLKSVNLELDHINGNERDNRKENLRLICSNCHSFTPTYKGRNINKFYKNGEKKVTDDVLLEQLKIKNIRQTLISVGMSASGENYERCKKLKERLTKLNDVLR